MVRVEQSLNQRYVDVEKLDAKLRQLFVRDFAYNVCRRRRQPLEWGFADLGVLLHSWLETCTYLAFRGS